MATIPLIIPIYTICFWGKMLKATCFQFASLGTGIASNAVTCILKKATVAMLMKTLMTLRRLIDALLETRLMYIIRQTCIL